MVWWTTEMLLLVKYDWNIANQVLLYSLPMMYDWNVMKNTLPNTAYFQDLLRRLYLDAVVWLSSCSEAQHTNYMYEIHSAPKNSSASISVAHHIIHCSKTLCTRLSVNFQNMFVLLVKLEIPKFRECHRYVNINIDVRFTVYFLTFCHWYFHFVIWLCMWRKEHV